MSRSFLHEADFGLLEPEAEEAELIQADIVERAIARFGEDLRAIRSGTYHPGLTESERAAPERAEAHSA